MSGEEGLRILVTNDDGINAHGLALLEQTARAFTGDVWVVAPETNHSGAGHSLTLRRPLRWRRVGERRFAVDGTPTDCVLLALQKLVDGKPVDLVLSGINEGSNMGEDVTYSGTIAAAMEATVLGVRAVALSQAYRARSKVRWATAERHAPEVLRRLMQFEWPSDVLVNVNFPDRPARAVSGIRITSQGRYKLGDELIQRRDPRGQPYVWIGDLKQEKAPHDGTDLAAVHDGWISVTPVHLDMTHYPTMKRLSELFEASTDEPSAEAMRRIGNSHGAEGSAEGV
jgi:5'-nucleotidase